MPKTIEIEIGPRTWAFSSDELQHNERRKEEYDAPYKKSVPLGMFPEEVRRSDADLGFLLEVMESLSRLGVLDLHTICVEKTSYRPKDEIDQDVERERYAEGEGDTGKVRYMMSAFAPIWSRVAIVGRYDLSNDSGVWWDANPVLVSCPQRIICRPDRQIEDGCLVLKYVSPFYESVFDGASYYCGTFKMDLGVMIKGNKKAYGHSNLHL